MEDNIALANFRRKKIMKTGYRECIGNLGYLTVDEAAFMEKLSRSMIVKYYKNGTIPVVKVGNMMRIKRDTFEKWLKKRDV